MKIEYYIGKKYNNLTILNYMGKDKYGGRLMEVQCDCEKGTIFTVLLNSLTREHTTSCGCFQKKQFYKKVKKYNTYDLTGEFGIGYTFKNEPFYFDLEDYDLIKDICWRINKNRIIGGLNRKNIEMSKVVTNTNSEKIIDHINLNTRDNRKRNLRVVTAQQNAFNTKGRGKLSKFGLKGISWEKRSSKWRGSFMKNGKIIYSMYFYSIIDIINNKIEAEKIHFGEYRYAWENDIKWDELLEYEKELKKNK